MKKQNNIKELESKLSKLLKKKSPLPPLKDAFFINGIEINLESNMNECPYIILLEDANFYELSIEIESFSSESLDNIASRNEQLTKISLSPQEKILYINKAIEILEENL